MGNMTIGNRSVGSAFVGNETVNKIYLGDKMVYIYDNYPIEDVDPYLFRKAGGTKSIGYKMKDKIVGGTVALNQILPQGHITSETVNGVQWTDNNDGTFKANGTADGNSTKVVVYFATTNSVISGHKYLIRTGYTDTTGNSFRTEVIVRNSNNEPVFYEDLFGGEKVVVASENGATIYTELRVFSGKTANNLVFKPQVLDITFMFGSEIADYVYSLEQATSGSGIAWLKKYGYLNKPYYAYNAGALMSVKTTKHITTSFNQWDEEWEIGTISGTTGQNATASNIIRSTNYIPVIPNKTYYMTISPALFKYDANYNYLGEITISNNQFTIPEDTHFIRFRTAQAYGVVYKHDICLNISNEFRNGEYEAYQKIEYPLDDVELRGMLKLDANNNLYYDGDTYESSGKVTRQYGFVDLGTLDWTYINDIFFTNINSTVKVVSSANSIGNICCPKYNNVSYNTLVSGNKMIASYNGYICIKDTDYTTVEAFKTAMSDVYIVYELAETTEETADPFINPQAVDPDGTEEYVDTRDVAIPVGHQTFYQSNN